MVNFPAKFRKSLVVLAFPVLLVLTAFAADAPFAGVELRIPDEVVPPGGMLQLKVEITEPKPILKGGQRNAFPAKFLGQVGGIALFSPKGDASGTAVLSKGAAQFSLSSPLASMGDSIDFPIVVVAVPVKTSAPRGQTAKLTFDPAWSEWVDPSGQNYPVLLHNGILTVGGTLSIKNIVPGGGLVKAGTRIAIRGMGFQPDSDVQINEAKLASFQYVSSNEIDVTLTSDINMTGRRVRVTNPATNERVEYFSYQRTVSAGVSSDPLIAATVPLFSQATWKLAYIKPVLTSSQFSGLAMQNESSTDAKVRLKLFASDGTVLASRSVTVAANRRITRTLAELLGVPAETGTALKVKLVSGPAVQVLGLLADADLGTVDPQEPSPTP